MSGRETSEEKTLPPSAKKLREARKKGQIPHSKETVTAVVTATAFAYLLMRFDALFAQLGDGLRAIPGLYGKPFAAAVANLLPRLGVDVALAVTPLIGALVMAAVLANIIVNRGVVVAVDPILPKMEHLDPVAGLTRMFGLKNVVELGKAVVKTAAVTVLAAVVIAGALQALVEIPACGLRCAAPVFGALLARLIFISLALLLLFGGADIGLQRWLFRRDMRMTRTEQKRERKESEGDPLIRRMRQRDHRRNTGPRTGLRNATFLIRSADLVLAMRYAAPDAMVPVLVARGMQEQAAKLLDDAKALGLPVVFDAATAELLASRLKVGGVIATDMFQPVIGCMREAGVI